MHRPLQRKMPPERRTGCAGAGKQVIPLLDWLGTGQPGEMDRIYERTMLFDFYGELLTEHQRAVYEDALYNDMSLGEIAEERGISRQGVHDLIKRCEKILLGYEDKLHLVERFVKEKETVREIRELSRLDYADKNFSVEDGLCAEMIGRLRRIGELSQKLLGEL